MPHVPPADKETQDDLKNVLKERRSRRGFLGGVGAAGSLAVFAAFEPAVASANENAVAGTALASDDANALRIFNLLKARNERGAVVAEYAAADPAPPALSLNMPAQAESSPGAAPPSSAAAALPQESTAIRMQRELKKALAKPIAERKWAMVIDTQKCIGCSACTIACKAENHLPPGVVYRPVMEEEVGTFPNVSLRFLPRPCQQCEDPPCVQVCPVAATWKREDGIVVIDYEACIGCRYCMTACPYSARYFDFGDNYSDGTPALQLYEMSSSPEYGREWDRSDDGSPVGNVRKCTFCAHRLDVGMLPACVTTCIGHATYFGDMNDTESLVSELIGSPRVMRLKEDLGTNPKVYYLT